MKRFLRTLGHAAIGGAAVGLAQAAASSSTPITAATVLLPMAASALTSVLSLWSTVPRQGDARERTTDLQKRN